MQLTNRYIQSINQLVRDKIISKSPGKTSDRELLTNVSFGTANESLKQSGGFIGDQTRHRTRLVPNRTSQKSVNEVELNVAFPD